MITESTARQFHATYLMNLKPGIITVRFGDETRTTHLYKKKNGQFVYWSPFTGERTVLRRSIPSTWESKRIKQLESRLLKSRKCPYK
jgi:hypothetical protein